MMNFERGFTLIELAIVLFILGLLLGAILPPLSAQIDQRARQETQAQLDEIKEVLYGFVFRQSGPANNKYRLPCPDCRNVAGGCSTIPADEINDGIEDVIGGVTCATEMGNLPWVTLGVSPNDSWSQRFTYRVTGTIADTNDGTGCMPNTVDVSFALCSEGDIAILDSAGGTNVASGVPAVVISHGKNWLEAPLADEAENFDDDTTFVYRGFAVDFDDLMIWISPHILRTKMLNAGILP